MDGVTILYIKQAFTDFEAILLCISIVGAAIFAAIAFATFDENIPVSGVFTGLVIVLIIAAIRIPRSDTLYEVTVDESVSYQELSTRYEVVSQRGQIITVREKEQKDDTDTENSAVSE